MYSFKEYREKPLVEASDKALAEIKALYDKTIKGIKNPDLVKKLEIIHDAVTKTSKKYNMPRDLVLKSVDVDQFYRGDINQ